MAYTDIKISEFPTAVGNLTGNEFFPILQGGVNKKASLNQINYAWVGAGTVTNVSALTIGTIGSDLSSTVADQYSTPVITLNVPDASATARGALTAADWTIFNSKQTALTAGTAISIAGNIVTNTAPDQTVVLTQGTGITVSGTYPSFTVTNSAPDLTVSFTNGAGISVTGTYPAFTVTNSAPMTYPGAGIALSTGSAWTTSLTAPSGAIVGTTDPQTVTNKRINPRPVAASATTGNITPNSDTTDIYLALGLTGTTNFQIPSGTPADGQKLMIRIKDNGTARTLTWVTTAGGYRVVGTTLPLTTVISKTIYIGCIYNTTDAFWDVVAIASQA